MTKRNLWPQDYFRMPGNVPLLHAHDAVVDVIRFGRMLDSLSYGFGDGFPTDFQEYVESSDEDDLDVQSDKKYCGFPNKFLDKGSRKPQSALTARRSNHLSAEEKEERERKAKELLDEEERLKKKAEKKKQKKMRQRERRRLEKMEKEDAIQSKDNQADLDSEKPKPTDKKSDNIDEKSKSVVVPPDPDSSKNPAADDNSNSSDSEDKDESSSTCEPEELDMNSCFVSNAAAIAKRKLEKKSKSERKPKKEENSGKQCVVEQQGASELQTQNINEEQQETQETKHDFLTKSVELAVVGNQYAAVGNLEMAVKFFTDAIKYNPKEYKLFGNRSFCYEKMQQYEKALTDADIALSMNPTWIKGLYRKGRALVGLKRYFEAAQTYKDVLKLDSTCTDAAQELMRVQIMQLMDMGFSREQSSNALIIHGTVEKALEALSGLAYSLGTPPNYRGERVEEDWVTMERRSQSPAHLPSRAVSQNHIRASSPVLAQARPPQPELFPVWVGGLISGITEAKLHDLFSSAGPVHSVKILQGKFCAFVNFTRREHCEKAIQDIHGLVFEGTSLIVRYPDRIHTHLGVSRNASTDPAAAAKNNKRLPDECHFWRTTGCVKGDRCTYRHIPENKGIDQAKPKTSATDHMVTKKRFA
ncbi:hsp70-Hsp90 organizing protein 3 [Chanos chanos]|uniref:Hsp70-Hsp90 organizing protein 3 n=1 Tax=Chanos chanos TaxID=29144 RepID=A0A6J2V794_CHACN|nr:hsp70-Hsp90 organizing protein 3-like [Chanos chanos]